MTVFKITCSHQEGAMLMPETSTINRDLVVELSCSDATVSELDLRPVRHTQEGDHLFTLYMGDEREGEANFTLTIDGEIVEEKMESVENIDRVWSRVQDRISTFIILKMIADAAGI